MAYLILLVCTINGLWIFRSRIFGGLAAEVLTIWNQSSMSQMVNSKVFAAGNTIRILTIFVLQHMASPAQRRMASSFPLAWRTQHT